MLSPALVSIERELETTPAAVGVTQTAFFTSAALFSLFLPRLGDMVGRRRVLFGMLAIMAIGCVVSAFATGIPMLFVGRVIQGLSGPTVPLCLIMLRHEIPSNKLYATLMGVVTAINGGVAGVDALAGGWLAANFGFRSVFWAMAAVAVVAALLVRFLTPESTGGEPAPMDWPGVLLLVLTVGAALIAINEAGKLAAANWWVVGVLLVVAAIAFAIFWRMSGRRPHPLISPAQMRQRSMWALLLTTLLTMTGIFAIMNGLVPGIAQDGAVGPGLAADAAAFWTLTPYALAGLVMGPVAGRLAGSIGYLVVLRVGMIGTLIGVIVLALTSGRTTPVLLLVLSIAIGVTYAGTVNIMLNGLGVVLSPREAPGMLPGLNAGAFNLGAGLSFAVLFAMQTAFAAEGSARGYQAGMFTGGALLLLAMLVSWLIPRPPEDAPDPATAAAEATTSKE
ncbi:MFS transporter [Granulicoccus sp. GXG6511]|uniref:uridine transporter UriT n=1 Tax=Granulicoccus sp. GXG6511 TaxID=3381351 RepID=UPI003D7DEE24